MRISNEIVVKLSQVPNLPGVYLHKNSSKHVIYVGKSVALKNRLKSYFTGSNHDPKTAILIKKIRDFEYFLTDSEEEALLLENTLIKKYQPKYNIRLRDDKTYPYIKIDRRTDFPRVYMTRKVSDRKSSYYGPFASASGARTLLRDINRLFMYRTCTKKITGKDARPCLEYFLKNCAAPCTGYISKENYGAIIKDVELFLQGHTNNAELYASRPSISPKKEFQGNTGPTSDVERLASYITSLWEYEFTTVMLQGQSVPYSYHCGESLTAV